MGIYNFFMSRDKVGCFGSVKTKFNGEYSLITWKPGSYGILTGLVPIDLPPFLPQHLHIAVHAPGYQLLSIQLGFDDDMAREWDPRDFVTKDPEARLNMTDSRIVLHEESTSEKISGIPVKKAKYDFVLRKDPENRSVEQQWQKYCTLPPYPIALCYPNLYKFLFFYGMYSAIPIFSGILGILIYVIMKLFCRCACGSNAKKIKVTIPRN